MIYLSGSLVTLWFCGLVFLAGRGLNLSRLVLNNLQPGATYFGKGDVKSFTLLGAEFRIQATAIDPSLLTEAGKTYQNRARLNDRIMIAWGAGGFILIGVLFSYLRT
ncbi:hypothetical protein QA635_15040 [Bradyrhizobium brasilense]|uniref:hypothetical protein n=1 Tax=Bradyrhizobium brasilense TaxID=1419277 RepID=UPI0024B09D44|nr:hypothetical protein [Bradyrhizobium australafricanum]WFU35643.1 hypothetical protein QA635_15040 [Bradyrhizobium australafricanum]